jgi:hypothetical protein
MRSAEPKADVFGVALCTNDSRDALAVTCAAAAGFAVGLVRS